MNNLQIFNFDNKEVRTVLIENEPYFVGRDVADILGYQNGSRDINRHVDEEDRLNYQNGTFESNRGMTVINESGVYSLVFGSKLPQAKKFKRWVTSEVLPQIRKTGCYQLPQSYKEALQELIMRIDDNEKLQLENSMKDQQIAELKPKADYTDIILKCKSLVTVTAIAKDYGMSATMFNKKLHELGIQYNQSGQWFLYSKYQDKGYTHSETVNITHSNGMHDVSMHTKWTQKGRLFIYDLLKSQNIVPVIERD